MFLALVETGPETHNVAELTDDGHRLYEGGQHANNWTSRCGIRGVEGAG